MAGVIAGNGAASDGKWRGVAPGAKLVSVKVAGPDGSTDVSVVIAALQWVVTHRAQYGIKVLNLSFGTDSLQPYAIDPLNAAVERAWAAGITVVVSSGNRGPGTINKPGDDPFVITVGAVDVHQTVDRKDDEVAPFSSSAITQDGFAKPDIVAPGTTIVATRDVGSTIDGFHQDAVVDEDYFKGTGTSQAGAVVSGVAALLYQANPTLKPSAVKSILMGSTFRSLPVPHGGGSGMVDALGALQSIGSGDWANAGLIRSLGAGSLEAQPRAVPRVRGREPRRRAGPRDRRDGRPRRPVGLELVVVDLLVVELLVLHRVVVVDRREQRMVEQLVELQLVERHVLELELVELDTPGARTPGARIVELRRVELRGDTT